MSLQTK